MSARATQPAVARMKAGALGADDTPALRRGVASAKIDGRASCFNANIAMPKIIPLTELRDVRATRAPGVSVPPGVPDVTPTGMLADARGRMLRDLRISVTDRCNFRCVYCMPKDVFGHDYPFLPHGDLLSFEEIARLARLFKAHGVEKIRLTGGEPLLRRNLERLIAMLAEIGGLDLTLTTNGSALQAKARALRDAASSA